MIVRNRVMHVHPASNVDEIGNKISDWKQNIRYLNEVAPGSHLDQDQFKTILISIMPETAADYLTQRYNKLNTLDEMETELTDYLDRMEQRRKEKGRKQLSAVTSDEPGKDKEVEWSTYYDATWGWICTAVPAAERQRTEDFA